MLHTASLLGELHVGVNGDDFVEQYKGRAPAQRELHRLWFVRQFRCVKSAPINDESGSMLIRLVDPDFLVVGSDWHERDYLAQIGMTPAELFGDLRCGIVYLPRTPGVSTSELRA